MLLDTSPEIEARQVEVWRKMGGERRLRLGFDLSLMARQLAKARILQDRPDQRAKWKDTRSRFAAKVPSCQTIPWAAFRDTSRTLDKVEIPYMLSGCCATNYHGAPRATVDIDFVIAANAAQTARFLELLPSAEFDFDLASVLSAAQDRSMFAVVNTPSGWKIDFVFHTPSAFDEERLRRRIQVKVEGISLFIETPEDLLLSQLQWTKEGNSYRQIEDAAGILKVSGDVLDFDYIRHWVEQLGLWAQWSAARKLAVLPGVVLHDIL